MEFKTADGTILTDADFDKMAEEYENGSWEGCGKVTLGRPKLFDEEMETVSFRIPCSRIEAVEAVSKRGGISKAEFFRRAIDRELIALG